MQQHLQGSGEGEGTAAGLWQILRGRLQAAAACRVPCLPGSGVAATETMPLTALPASEPSVHAGASCNGQKTGLSLMAVHLGDRYQLQHQPWLQEHLQAAIECDASKRWPGCAQSKAPPLPALYVQACLVQTCQQGSTCFTSCAAWSSLPGAKYTSLCAFSAASAMGRGSALWALACAPQRRTYTTRSQAHHSA